MDLPFSVGHASIDQHTPAPGTQTMRAADNQVRRAAYPYPGHFRTNDTAQIGKKLL
jgi:hypothetical protein